MNMKSRLDKLENNPIARQHEIDRKVVNIHHQLLSELPNKERKKIAHAIRSDDLDSPYCRTGIDLLRTSVDYAYKGIAPKKGIALNILDSNLSQ